MAGRATGRASSQSDILWEKGVKDIYALDHANSWFETLLNFAAPAKVRRMEKYPAQIIAVKNDLKEAKIHFPGFNSRYDRWVQWGCNTVISAQLYREYSAKGAEPPIPTASAEGKRKRSATESEELVATVEGKTTQTPSGRTADTGGRANASRRRLNYQYPARLTEPKSTRRTASLQAPDDPSPTDSGDPAVITVDDECEEKAPTKDATKKVDETGVAAAPTGSKGKGRARQVFMVPPYNRWKPSRPMEMSLRQKREPTVVVDPEAQESQKLAGNILSFLTSDVSARTIRDGSPKKASETATASRTTDPARRGSHNAAKSPAETTSASPKTITPIESLLNRKLIQRFNGVGDFEGVITKVNRKKNTVTVHYEDDDIFQITKRKAMRCIEAYEKRYGGATEEVSKSASKSDKPTNEATEAPSFVSKQATPATASGGARRRLTSLAQSPPAKQSASGSAGKRSTRKGKSGAVIAALANGSVEELRAALVEESERADAAEAEVATLMVKLRAISEVSNMLSTTISTTVSV